MLELLSPVFSVFLVVINSLPDVLISVGAFIFAGVGVVGMLRSL